ncbi:hypothetical protein CC86DRAFT_174687 [Ophiobolus disseminans]|uniref:Uncharacterized protein n=1 Tax=Ophiobolus disseminans TaxID=1469910 RepID=A0A6A7A8Z9_9PLEO|nr:hypothetical protein CC86DRAFT_174687 [Ophiobolus disseminans]
MEYDRYLVTKPSSSSKALSSKQQAAGFQKGFDSVGDRCQTVYDDGGGQYIVECRRRSSMIHHADAKDAGRRRHTRPTAANVLISQESLSSLKLRGNASIKVSSSWNAKPSRDGSSSRRSNKAQSSAIVVIATSKPVVTSIREKIQAPSAWARSSPPPTPRLGRLETPELSDLDEAPFCNCGMASNTYCKSCKQEANFPLVRVG